MVTGDSQEEVLIFRYTQTDRHFIIIYIIIIIIIIRWLEQKKEIRLQQEQRGGGKELLNNLGGTQCNNTVIKVTPKGLRKITLFEENFKQ